VSQTSATFFLFGGFLPRIIAPPPTRLGGCIKNGQGVETMYTQEISPVMND
jgi:hypothetical protein